MSDKNLDRLLTDLKPFAKRPLGTIRIDMDDVRSILALATHAAQIEALRAERDRYAEALVATRDHCPQCHGDGKYPFGPKRNQNIVPCEFCEAARAALGETPHD